MLLIETATYVNTVVDTNDPQWSHTWSHFIHQFTSLAHCHSVIRWFKFT